MKQWLETREVLDCLARVRGAGQRAALATVVRGRGSAYRHGGAKLGVDEVSSTAGNVSGGCLEQDVREVALEVIRKGESELRSYCSSADEIAAWDLGVGCEGQVDVYVERAEARPRERALLDGRRSFVVCTLLDGKGETGKGKRVVVTPDGVDGDLGSGDVNRKATTRARELLETGESGMHEIAGRSVFFDVLVPPPQLVVLGAGDDAGPLVRFAADVGFRVVVVDRRPGYLTRERFPGAAALGGSTASSSSPALSTRAAAPGNRSRVRYPGRRSTTTTRNPTSAANRTSGRASSPAPKTTSWGGGTSTSKKIDRAAISWIPDSPVSSSSRALAATRVFRSLDPRSPSVRSAVTISRSPFPLITPQATKGR